MTRNNNIGKLTSPSQPHPFQSVNMPLMPINDVNPWFYVRTEFYRERGGHDGH